MLRDPTETLKRVVDGEEIRDEDPITATGLPGLPEAALEALVKGEVLDPDGQDRQAAKQWILTNPPLPVEPHKKSLSEVLIEMRDEENW